MVFTWHPETKELWFTDNGRDMLGDDIPCELNYAPKGNAFAIHCHGVPLKDPEFGNKRPVVILLAYTRAHTAPLGIKFYSGAMFPSAYKNRRHCRTWFMEPTLKIDIALAWLRLKTITRPLVMKPCQGWLDDETQKAWGRCGCSGAIMVQAKSDDQPCYLSISYANNPFLFAKSSIQAMHPVLFELAVLKYTLWFHDRHVVCHGVFVVAGKSVKTTFDQANNLFWSSLRQSWGKALLF